MGKFQNRRMKQKKKEKAAGIPTAVNGATATGQQSAGSVNPAAGQATAAAIQAHLSSTPIVGEPLGATNPGNMSSVLEPLQHQTTSGGPHPTTVIHGQGQPPTSGQQQHHHVMQHQTTRDLT